MKISVIGGRPASSGAIETLEHGLGFPISASFKEFISRHDGAEPEDNVFDIGAGENKSGVRQFIPVGEILEERRAIEGFPAHLYPVGFDDCGNFIAIDERRDGAVLFWDHETGDLTWIAPDFAALLERLEPFDPESVKLDPKNVKSVWVHPDFQKYLKR